MTKHVHFIAGLLSAWLALIAPSAAAQDNAVDDEGGIICIAVATPWLGSEEEIARIRQEPVPGSFRRPFESDGCARFQLVEESLLQWHFRFGDEATASQALAYLEAQSLAGAPSGEALDAGLQQAYSQALPTLQAMQEARAEGDYQALEPLRMRASLRQLSQAARPYYSHRFLADQYLTAARFYGSTDFVRRAAPHVAAFERFGAFLAANAGQAQAHDDIGFVLARDYQSYMLLLPQRYATLRFDLLGEGEVAQDFAPLASRHVVDRIESLVWDLEPFNRLHELEDDDDELRAALDMSSNLARHQVLQWSEQAFARLARDTADESYMGDCGEEPVELALMALYLQSTDNTPSSVSRPYRRVQSGVHYGDMRVALLLAQADCAVAVAARVDSRSRRHLMSNAFTALTSAHAIVSADHSPGRFRQIATRYLHAAQFCAEGAEDGERCAIDYDPRTVRYFRDTLAALPHIRGVTLQSDTP